MYFPCIVASVARSWSSDLPGLVITVWRLFNADSCSCWTFPAGSSLYKMCRCPGPINWRWSYLVQGARSQWPPTTPVLCGRYVLIANDVPSETTLSWWKSSYLHTFLIIGVADLNTETSKNWTTSKVWFSKSDIKYFFRGWLRCARPPRWTGPFRLCPWSLLFLQTGVL